MKEDERVPYVVHVCVVYI